MWSCVSGVLCLDKLYFLHSTEILHHERTVCLVFYGCCVSLSICPQLLMFFMSCALMSHTEGDHACVWPADPLFSSLGLRFAAGERQDASHGRRRDPQRGSKGPPRPGQVLPVQHLSAQAFYLYAARHDYRICHHVWSTRIECDNVLTVKVETHWGWGFLTACLSSCLILPLPLNYERWQHLIDGIHVIMWQEEP